VHSHDELLRTLRLHKGQSLLRNSHKSIQERWNI